MTQLKFFIRITWLLIFFVANAFAANNFKQGKEYQLINNANDKTVFATASKPNQILVQEFFSYGCPWCFHLEPFLETWLKQKPKYIEFQRVPVIFENNWDIYAKAYYAANALGIEPQFTPAFFKAIHEQGKTFSSLESVAPLLEKYATKIPANKITAALHDSLALDLEVKQANELMMSYKVFQIPTFVVAGKYKTDAGMVNGNEKKLLAVVNYLAKKAAQEQKIKI